MKGQNDNEMSAAGIHGGGSGKATIESWLSYHRLPFRPFLRSNLEKAIRYHETSKMGSSSSSLRKAITPFPAQECEILASSDEEDSEDEGPRPAKRRKTDTSNSTPALAPISSNRSMSSFSNPAQVAALTSVDHSVNEDLRKATRIPSRSQVNKIKPTDFYGAPSSNTGKQKTNSSVPKSKPSRFRIDSVLKLTEPPVDFEKLLRIRVASIVQRSVRGETEDESSQYSNIKCTLALLRILEDEASMEDVYRQPQTGRIRRTPEGRYNDTFPVYLPSFHIPSAVLFQDPDFDDSSDRLCSPNEFGKLRVQVSLEPYNANRKDWLPLKISSLPHNSLLARRISKGEARLTDVRQIVCEFPLLDWDSKQSTSQIELIYDGTRVETLASLKLDVKWSLPHHLNQKEEHVEAPRSPSPVPELAPELALPDPQSLQKADTTEPGSPFRAQRRGRANIPTYNLKALSAKAQGKKLRARWSKDSSGASVAATDTGENVTYTFSKSNVEAYGIKQIYLVAGFSCPVCYLDTKSLENLRLHFTTTHDRFTFHARPKSSFYVEFNKEARQSTTIHPLRTYQLGRATTLLDVEKYLSGTSSWEEAREGPQNNAWPDGLGRPETTNSPSPSPQNSRQSSPEMHDSDTEIKEDETSVPVPAYIRRLASLPVRNMKKYHVPNIHATDQRSIYNRDAADQVFYDLRTKRVLKPEEELPDSDDEKDESWLLHKRKWIINDYTDLTDAEKEYLIKWEEFIMLEKLSSMMHLQETVLRFVARNRVWFAEKKARKREWRKHVELFIVRDKLADQPLLSRCDQIFGQGKRELEARNSNVDYNSEINAKVGSQLGRNMRGATDCVCGDPTQDPDLIICGGEVGLFKYYQ